MFPVPHEKGKEVNWEKIKWGKVSKHEEQVKRAKKRDKLCQQQETDS